MGKLIVFKILFLVMWDVVNLQIVKMDMDYVSLEVFIYFFYIGFVKDDFMDLFVDKLFCVFDIYGILLFYNFC